MPDSVNQYPRRRTGGVTPDFPIESTNTFVFEISRFKKTILEKDKDLTIEFTKVVSKTGPGKANLSLTMKFESETRNLQQLPIEKVPSAPGIIAFYSDPPE